MENYEEIIDALKAGETLIGRQSARKFKLKRGKLLCIDGEQEKYVSYDFSYPQNWQIYKEPKWYENIPEGGVLCWVKNGSQYDCVRVTSYEKDVMYGWRTGSGGFDGKPKPLTKQEIQVFMDNAPEAGQ